jgi:hypothetical protein
MPMALLFLLWALESLGAFLNNLLSSHQEEGVGHWWDFSLQAASEEEVATVFQWGMDESCQ